ncbi:MAG TPA: membrane dipeptidase [Candidatus Limnocylindria bacterium]|nr:membrane dipeptidase [Candidatus Limnocylindria bacterium]
MSTAIDTRGISLSAEQEERARRLHGEAIVIDCSSVVKQEPSHIERARAGGVTATNHTVTRPMSDLPTALAELNSCRRWIDQHPDDVLLGTSVDDIDEAKRTNREAIIFGPQNTEFIGTDLNVLGTAYDLGVRILQLTYQRQNWVGSGCGERRDAGLSMFGRELVSEMNELGIVVDVSHCGQVTGADAIEVSRTPVVVSHGHPSRVAPHARAKDDDLLRALAAAGGVIGVTAISMFLYDLTEQDVRPGLRDLARHLEYLIDLIGVDHVGIGLDFDETNTPEKYAADAAAHPEIYTQTARFGWDDKRIHKLTSAAEELSVTNALVSLGLSDEDVLKVLGGNWLRIFKEVWRS